MVFRLTPPAYTRFRTRKVNIGGIPMGADNPIRIQSMTTTDTMDTETTVAQTIRLAEAGCDYVRITAPSKKEAENLAVIKKELRKRECNVPLVADIHFTPNAAEIAARMVEKVRVNPGNYADKKKFQQIEYTDSQYQAELDRIREKFIPLVRICKEEGTAMRIGTNHGSLSDRIMSRYGDTPLGMVESALEFVRICESEGYHEIVLSMKASNPQVMVQAYRLLVKKMTEEGMNYPLHLGVTEAGDGEDGRIKSAVGIGTLLEEGLGDTIRVSLTEEPEAEVPVAKELVRRYDRRQKTEDRREGNNLTVQQFSNSSYSPFEYQKRLTRTAANIGGDNVPVVVADFSLKKEIKPATLFAVGYKYSVPLDKWSISDYACDYIFVGDNKINFEIPGTLGIIYNHKQWLEKQQKQTYPFIMPKDYLSDAEQSPELNFIYATIDDLSDEFIEKLKSDKTAVLLIDTYNENGLAEQRQIFLKLLEHKCDVPVIIGRAYGNLTPEQLQLYSATDMGGLLIDGFGDGLFIAAENCGSDKMVNETAFNILQNTRTRTSKTEYISCPSCGRTLFDLQETTAKIRSRTNHLKGVKIGIMGCIVNGPGEMADADYGYVGSGPGKITLYKGKEVVKRNVATPVAVDELIRIIKEDGKWVEEKKTEI